MEYGRGGMKRPESSAKEPTVTPYVDTMQSRVLEQAASRGGSISEDVESSVESIIEVKDRMEQIKRIIEQRKGETAAGLPFAPANFPIKRRPRGVPLNKPIIRKPIEPVDDDLRDMNFHSMFLSKLMEQHREQQEAEKLDDDPTKGIAEGLVSMHAATAQKAQNTVEALNAIPTRTREDDIAIRALVNSNNQLASEVLTNVQPLVKAISEGDENLLDKSLDAVINLDDSIKRAEQRDFAIADQAVPSKATFMAATIEDARNEGYMGLLGSVVDMYARMDDEKSKGPDVYYEDILNDLVQAKEPMEKNNEKTDLLLRNWESFDDSIIQPTIQPPPGTAQRRAAAEKAKRATTQRVPQDDLINLCSSDDEC